jgi:hypothetical protein
MHQASSTQRIRQPADHAAPLVLRMDIIGIAPVVQKQLQDLPSMLSHPTPPHSWQDSCLLLLITCHFAVHAQVEICSLVALRVVYLTGNALAGHDVIPLSITTLTNLVSVTIECSSDPQSKHHGWGLKAKLVVNGHAWVVVRTYVGRAPPDLQRDNHHR